jgi:multidrug resistance efflux pump
MRVQRSGRGILVQVVVFVVLLAALAIGLNYWYQGQNYVTTSDAQVSAPTAAVGSLVAGTLASWTVSPGDQVTAGQVLGTVQPAAASLGPSSGSAAAAPPAVNITAPFAGTVLESTAVAGETVAPGTALAYVGNLSAVGITAYVKETKIRNVAAGQKVDVRVDAFPGTTFSGTVKQVGLAAAGTFSLLPTTSQGGEFTKVTQRIPVTISLDGAGGGLIPGESAEVRIHIR